MNIGRHSVAWITGAGLALVALTACSGPIEPDTAPEASDESAAQAPQGGIRKGVDFRAAASQIQSEAIRSGDRVIAQCAAMQRSIDAFLDDPDDSGRDTAREAFHDCYAQWHRYGIFHQQPFTLKQRNSFDRTTRLINTRPFHPGYIDGLPEHPYSGLVFETGMTLTLATLLDQHHMLDAESAALGFPVIETLLWREPLPKIWLQDEAGADDTNSAPQRRHQYLSLAGDDLMIRLKSVTQRWRPGNDYAELPQGTQRRVFWQSAHRLVQVGLLEAGFSKDSLSDPEWHHPSAIAGQGRRHWQAQLEGLTTLLVTPEDEPTALARWLDSTGVDPGPAKLEEHLYRAQSAIQALPANYPFDARDNAQWRQARDAIKALAAALSASLQQLDLAPTQRNTQ